MKKTTTKTAAKAEKKPAEVVKKTVAKKTVKKAAPAPAPAPVVEAPAPAPAPVAKKAAPAVKKAAPAPVVTVITASIDVGFGHSLYIRGEGPGLSWDVGVPMACIADDQWRITLGETTTPIVFKFLVDDLSWSTGEDYVATPGSALLLTPAF